MDWKDWEANRFPPNGGSLTFIDDEARRVGEGGKIVGFQYSWDWGSNHYEGHWIIWSVDENGRRVEDPRSETPPIALVSIFQYGYSRSMPGHIPLMAFTAEEWATLCEASEGHDGRES